MANNTVSGFSGNRLAPTSVSQWKSLYQAGRIDDCEHLAREWTRLYPKDGKTWQLLGIALLARGAMTQALPILRQACQLTPKDWSIWDSLAIALQRMGNHNAASKAFQKSLKLAPQNASVWSNASTNQLEEGNFQEALRLAKQSVSLDSNLAAAQLSLGNALSGLGRSEDAEVAFRHALQIQPRFPQALLSLGRELGFIKNRYEEAIDVTRQALDIQPGYPDAHVNLASFLNMLGDVSSAAVHYRLARDLNPDMISAWSGMLFCILHDERLSPDEVFAEHAAFGNQVEAPWKQGWTWHPNTPDPSRRLRVGFVSPDFRDHPVSRFLEPVWRHLDKNKVETVAYDTQRINTACRLKELAAQWVNAAHMSDELLEKRIRSDAIDILFDLSGHTSFNRLGVFARKPAPIQVSWLGYPGTTGLTAMDYRLVDRIAAPPGRFDRQFSERLAYLPFMAVFDRPANLPAVGRSPILDNGYITFGSFNRLGKLGEGVITAWARILNNTSRSRLMIGAVPNDRVAAELRSRFNRYGVTEDRLIVKPRLDMAGYLALHEEVDLQLDTWPFSSGTTANFALWLGVPTLTLSGPSMVQRLCASRLAAAGLQEFITESEQQYIDLAIKWANKPDELADLRAGLRTRMDENAVTHPVLMARALEHRLREMWQRWCAGLAPETLE